MTKIRPSKSVNSSSMFYLRRICLIDRLKQITKSNYWFNSLRGTNDSIEHWIPSIDYQRTVSPEFTDKDNFQRWNIRRSQRLTTTHHLKLSTLNHFQLIINRNHICLLSYWSNWKVNTIRSHHWQFMWTDIFSLLAKRYQIRTKMKKHSWQVRLCPKFLSPKRFLYSLMKR